MKVATYMLLATLPETGFIRLPAVLAVFSISKSSWYEGIKKGLYPASFKLSERTAAWRVEDIRDLIKQKSAASQ